MSGPNPHAFTTALLEALELGLDEVVGLTYTHRAGSDPTITVELAHRVVAGAIARVLGGDA